MKSKRILWGICMDIYSQMYRESEPSADFDELIKKGITKKPSWFADYYLSQDRQDTIVNEHSKKNKLTQREEYQVSKEVNLGSSPSNWKEKP